MALRDYIRTSSSGYVYYLPASDIRKDLGFNPKELPPPTTTDQKAYNKIIWMDYDKMCMYYYDDKGVRQEWSVLDTHPSTDQEIRKVLEFRLPNRMEGGSKYGSGLHTYDDSGTRYEYDHHKDSPREHDFDQGGFHPKPKEVGDIGPGRGTPAFDYATNSKLRKFADVWIAQKERQFDPQKVSQDDQASLYTCNDNTAKMFVALKIAQAESQNYPKYVKEYHQKVDDFTGADIKDAPKIPHVTTKFFPHQAKVLAQLARNERMLMGIAAGGGKTLIALSDILHLIATGKIKRGCIVMPTNLIPQQKGEIKKFTNNTVNVFCLSNDVVRRYCPKRSDDMYDLRPLEKMIVKMPPNTIFLASYEFFVAEHYESAGGGQVYPRVPWLIKKCGIDLINLDECLHKDTMVMVDYDKAISIGDLIEADDITHVLSYDLEKKKIVRKPIVQKMVGAPVEPIIFNIKLEDESGKEHTLKLTRKHKVPVIDQGDVKAQNLEIGSQGIKYDVGKLNTDDPGEIDELANNHRMTIKSVQPIPYSNDFVFNLHVKDTHNFFVLTEEGTPMLVGNSHRVKNDSYASEAMLTAAPMLKYRRAMSGTIVSNNPKDVFRQAAFVDPSVLGDEEDFLARYAEVYNTRGTVKKWKDGGVKALRKRLGDNIAVQVSRPNWMYMLPKFNRTYHRIELPKAHIAIYRKIIEDILAEIENDPKLKSAWEKYKALPPEEQESAEFKVLLAKLSRFEQFIGCPLIEKFASVLPKEERISAKVPKVDELLDKHFANVKAEKLYEKLGQNSNKVIVFSTYADVVHHMWQNSKYNKVSTVYIASDKSTAPNMVKFKEDPKIKVIFAAEKGLREGHNLQMANRIIRTTLPWNPGDLDQTNARIFRAGQKHEDVNVDILVADDTAEVTKAARLITKLQLNTKLLTDYDDTEQLDPIFMNVDTMTHFNKFDEHFKPYISLEDRINEFDITEATRLEKIQGQDKVSLETTKKISGSKTAVTPYVIGDDTATTAPDEKAVKSKPDERDDPPAGAIADLDWTITNFDKSNYLIAYQKKASLPQLKKCGAYWDENIWVVRTKTAQQAKWVLDALESMGIGINDKVSYEKWIDKHLPNGPSISKSLPGNTKKKVTTITAETSMINKRWHVIIYASDVSSIVKAAMGKIVVEGNKFQLFKNAGYHFINVTNKAKLLKYLTRARDAGYGVANMKDFKVALDKWLPGSSKAVAKLFSSSGKDEEE